LDTAILGRAAHGDRLIIVGGPPRSGTTLVQNILDMHPEITGAPEFLHFPDIVRMRQAMSANIARGWLEEYCTQEELDEYLRRFVESLFRKVATRTQYISEKTPQNVLCFQELIELFPGAKYVNIVRDPRAIVASLLQVYNRAREKGITVYPSYVRDVFKAIAYTKLCLQKGLEFTAGNAGKVYTLKYEALLSNPEMETRKLCEYLGVAWREEMLRPSSQKHMGEAAITKNSGEIWYDKKMFYRDPDKANLEKWRETLSVADTLLINRAFAEWGALDSLGYNFDLAAFSLKAKLVATARGGWRRATALVRRRVNVL
jgi:hypothetical protein